MIIFLVETIFVCAMGGRDAVKGEIIKQIAFF